jgi:hypothetical protein
MRTRKRWAQAEDTAINSIYFYPRIAFSVRSAISVAKIFFPVYPG